MPPSPPRSRSTGPASSWAHPTSSQSRASRAASRRRGGRALALGTDLGDPEGIARLADVALDAFGRLDVAVNAPGRARGLDDLAEPDCRAVYFAVRHQLPAIAASGGGTIVNVALGPLGWSDDARCVVGLTRASALERADSGVRINALARGPGSRGFAAAACWLCSDAAAHLNGAVVTGPAGPGDRGRRSGGPAGGCGGVAAQPTQPGRTSPCCVGEHDQLGAVAGGELHHCAAHVGLGGGRAHDEPLGDLLVRQPTGHESHHLALALGELLEGAGRGRLLGARRELLDRLVPRLDHEPAPVDVQPQAAYH